MQHSVGLSCEPCESKLVTAHVALQSWFKSIKEAFPDCHISWAYRDKEDQEIAYKTGHSNRQWPNSPHNNEKDGLSCSLALDLFQLVDHRASFDPIYYTKIWEYSQSKLHSPIVIWGGNFKTFKDYCHFQVNF